VATVSSGADEHSIELTIVTGMSGAGRTTAARALEDLGWFVIDNIPPSLLAAAVDLARKSRDVHKVAVVVDARGGSFFPRFRQALEELSSVGVSKSLVFLEASDESLVRRFESSRRPHPLQRGARILDGLEREREVLADLRAMADLVIDTTNLNVHDLRRRIEDAFSGADAPLLRLTVMSFGFKYGIPVDADMVFDARFLPNPYWDENLRPMSGRDAAVASRVLGEDGADAFVAHVIALLETVRDGYIREGKRFGTVAIGCTGGRHRSVALVEEVVNRLDSVGIDSVAVHRDLGRE
jgi:UPF0042 nucleotide-binding protein